MASPSRSEKLAMSPVKEVASPVQNGKGTPSPAPGNRSANGSPDAKNSTLFGFNFVKWVDPNDQSTKDPKTPAVNLPLIPTAESKISPAPVFADGTTGDHRIPSKKTEGFEVTTTIESRTVLPAIVLQSGQTFDDVFMQFIRKPTTTKGSPSRSVSGQYEEDLFGIGVELEEEATGTIFVAALIPGGTAIQTALRAGDRILAVDGVDCSQRNVSEVASLIKGRQGSVVELEVVRSGAEYQQNLFSEVAAIRIPRAPIAVDPNDPDEHAGVGVSFRREASGRVTVVEVKQGGPAWGSALQIGDVLMKVDGRDVFKMSAPALGDAIKGPIGSQVTLLVLQHNVSQLHTAIKSDDLVSTTTVVLTRGHVQGPAPVPQSGPRQEFRATTVGGGSMSGSPQQQRVPSPAAAEAAPAAAGDGVEQGGEVAVSPTDGEPVVVPLNEGEAGLGLTLEQAVDGRVFVAGIAPGGPADGTPLALDDVIVRVDGASTASHIVDQVAMMIRGPIGTWVEIDVQRPDAEVIDDFTRLRLKRGAVPTAVGSPSPMAQMIMNTAENGRGSGHGNGGNGGNGGGARGMLDFNNIPVQSTQSQRGSQQNESTVPLGERPLGGVGVTLEQATMTGRVYIFDVNPHGPAAGRLFRNDTILEVDGLHVAGLNVAQVATLMRGPEGTQTELLLDRPTPEAAARGWGPAERLVVMVPRRAAHQPGPVQENIGPFYGSSPSQSAASQRGASQRGASVSPPPPPANGAPAVCPPSSPPPPPPPVEDATPAKTPMAKKMVGVGIGIGRGNGNALVISEIARGSAADGTALTVGQKILRVCGHDVTDLDEMAVVGFVVGEPGTLCELDVVPEGLSDDEYATVRLRRRPAAPKGGQSPTQWDPSQGPQRLMGGSPIGAVSLESAGVLAEQGQADGGTWVSM